LEKIVQSLGTVGSGSSSNSVYNSSNNQYRGIGTGSVLKDEAILQYEAQNHVLVQLEDKLKVLLSQQQQQLTSNNATLMMKLKRDFDRVQVRVGQLQQMADTKMATMTQQQQQQRATTNVNPTSPFFGMYPSNGEDNNNTDIVQQHQQLQQIQIQEDRLQEEIMREREEEIRNINRGMHTVHEIYKDLAHLVSQQQHDIDTIETQMEDSHTNAQQGLQQVEKANEKYGQSNCIIM
jgi:t-SNARE complex subunit (syntaxin)